LESTQVLNFDTMPADYKEHFKTSADILPDKASQ
jgi:hypothetical protein